jgi:hypothetical protein
METWIALGAVSPANHPASIGIGQSAETWVGYGNQPNRLSE